MGRSSEETVGSGIPPSPMPELSGLRLVGVSND